MNYILPMYRDEAGTQRLGDVAGSDRSAPSGAGTTSPAANGHLSASPYGADLLDIFRRARPEA